MQTPLQLTFRSMAHSDAVAAHVGARADKLEHLFDGIISCHVVVDLAERHHHHVERYHASINLGLPGHELIASHHLPDGRTIDSAAGAVDRAFDEVGRQLEDWVRRRRGGRHAAD